MVASSANTRRGRAPVPATGPSRFACVRNESIIVPDERPTAPPAGVGEIFLLSLMDVSPSHDVGRGSALATLPGRGASASVVAPAGRLLVRALPGLHGDAVDAVVVQAGAQGDESALRRLEVAGDVLA